MILATAKFHWLFESSQDLPSDGSSISSWLQLLCSPHICSSNPSHKNFISNSLPLHFLEEYQKWFLTAGIYGTISLFCFCLILLLLEILINGKKKKNVIRMIIMIILNLINILSYWLLVSHLPCTETDAPS